MIGVELLSPQAEHHLTTTLLSTCNNHFRRSEEEEEELPHCTGHRPFRPTDRPTDSEQIMQTMAQLQATAVLPAVRLPDDDDDDGDVHFDSKHGKLTSLGRTYAPGVLTHTHTHKTCSS